MFKVFEYQCPIHGRFEKFETNPAAAHACPNCGSESARALSAPRSQLEGVTGAFPTAADKWARLHEQAGRKQ